MHIGFITIESPQNTKQGGGIAAYLRAITPALISAGHRITIIAHAPREGVEYAYDQALRIVHIHLPNLHWYSSKVPLLSQPFTLPLRQVEWSLKFYKVAQEVFNDDPVDVVESSEMGALWLAKRPIAPLIIRLHGNEYVFRKYSGLPIHLGIRLNHYLEKKIWCNTKTVTSPSHFQAAEICREMDWTPGRVHIIPNPIVPEVLTEGLKPRLSTDVHTTPAPVVLYTGRLAPVKGVKTLTEAAIQVHKKSGRVRFVLAGPWQMPDQPESWGLVKDVTSKYNIKWLGHLPWRQLIGWYRQATLFIMPSNYETFGISVLEAMAFGLPVIATNTGGLPEVIEDGVTGLLVPPGKPEALAEAVLYLLNNPELCRRLGQAGQQRMLTKFTVNQVIGPTIQLYESICR